MVWGISIATALIIAIVLSATLVAVMTRGNNNGKYDKDDDDIEGWKVIDDDAMMKKFDPWVATLPLTDDQIKNNYERFDDVVVQTLDDAIQRQQQQQQSSTINIRRYLRKDAYNTDRVNVEKEAGRISTKSKRTSSIVGWRREPRLLNDEVSLPNMAISLEDIFDSKDTHQHEAREWLVRYHDLDLLSEERIIQRYAMAVIYISMGGGYYKKIHDGCDGDSRECPEWYDEDGCMEYYVHENKWFSSNWKEENYDEYYIKNNEYFEKDNDKFYYKSGDESSYDEEYDTIFELNLEDNNLKGSIPYEIVLPSNLETINLANNDIYGSVPEQLSDLSGLLYLDLSSNIMAGTIPFSSLKSPLLESVSLEGNKLQGNIPEDNQYGIEYLRNIEELHLGYKSLLRGTIPKTLSQLSKLRELSLDGTDITGTVPMEVCALTVKSSQLSIYADCDHISGCVQCAEDGSEDHYHK
jgi:hypothetical protein